MILWDQHVFTLTIFRNSSLSSRPLSSLSKTLKDHLSLSSSFPRRTRWSAATYSIKSIVLSWKEARYLIMDTSTINVWLDRLRDGICAHKNIFLKCFQEHKPCVTLLFLIWLNLHLRTDPCYFNAALYLTWFMSNARKMLSMYCDSGVPFCTPNILLNSCRYKDPLGHSMMNDL